MECQNQNLSYVKWAIQNVIANKLLNVRDARQAIS